MRHLVPIALAVATATASICYARPIASTDIFELETAADPDVSPDGATVAYVRRSNDIMTDRARSSIWTVSVNGNNHRPVLSGKRSFSSPRSQQS